MNTAAESITVTQDPNRPVEREILAQAILRIADAAKQLAKSGLNRRAIVVLLRDATRVSKENIEALYLSPGYRVIVTATSRDDACSVGYEVATNASPAPQ